MDKFPADVDAVQCCIYLQSPWACLLQGWELASNMKPQLHGHEAPVLGTQNTYHPHHSYIVTL